MRENFTARAGRWSAAHRRAAVLDATVVRAILLPATMKLLGDWNWYLPHGLGWLPQRRPPTTRQAQPAETMYAPPEGNTYATRPPGRRAVTTRAPVTRTGPRTADGR